MPHGNSHQNQNDYHLYEIKDLQEDEVFKYGISDEPIGQDGLSKRMRVQLYILNLGAAWIRYAAQILMTGIPGRKKAEEIRLVAVGDKAAKTAIFSADKAFFMWNSRAISHKKKRSQAGKWRFYAALGFPPQQVY